MDRKLTLIYSPCQVSKHYQKTRQTVDWEICFPPCTPLETPFQLPYFFVQITFKCRDFQTDVPFNVMFRSVLRALTHDHVPSLKLAIKNCPLECMATVTLEILHLQKTFGSNDDGCEKLSPSYHLNIRGRSIKNITLSQLYQTSMLYYLRRANLETCTYMQYTLEGSQLMTEDAYYRQNEFGIKLDFRCPHKTRSLEFNLQQRNLCLIFILGIGSLVDFANPARKWRWNMFEIKIDCCQVCIPVVLLAIKYLLNTLSYFQAFLPADRFLRIASPDHRNFGWKSTWPVGRLYNPDILFYKSGDSVSKLCICINTHWEYLWCDPIYPMVSSRGAPSPYERCTTCESHSHMLPKS